MILEVERIRLLVQEEDVTMRRTSRGRSRSNPISNEGSVELECRRLSDFDVRLDPVQDGTQYPEGWEGGVDVQAHDHVFGVGLCAGEGELWWILGIWLWSVEVQVVLLLSLADIGFSGSYLCEEDELRAAHSRACRWSW